MYFRVGGTTADAVWFVDSTEPLVRDQMEEVILNSMWHNMKT